MHLVDTNVLSELMRARPDARVVAWTEAQSRILLSVITLEEIHFGLALKPSARVEAWLEKFEKSWCEILPVTAQIARRAGTMRAALREDGQTRSQADMLIAATAWEHRLPLATRNTGDFAGCGIRVVNPFAR